MKTMIRIFLTTTALLLLSAGATAQVSLNSTRIVAADVLATGAFYQSAFCMHEVNRLTMQNGDIEMFLNFGSDVDFEMLQQPAQ